MRFKALPVTGLEDVTLDFEQLSARAILDKTPNNFLQLLSTQKLVLSLGTQLIPFPGASNYSNVMTIAHGLSAAPADVDAIASTSPGAAMMIFQTAAPDATNIYLQAYYVPGQPAAGNFGRVNWKAFG